MRANAILYEMMPDIVKYPTELMPEMSALIPIFIENLGNSKVSPPPPQYLGNRPQIHPQVHRHLR